MLEFYRHTPDFLTGELHPRGPGLQSLPVTDRPIPPIPLRHYCYQ